MNALSPGFGANTKLPSALEIQFLTLNGAILAKFITGYSGSSDATTYPYFGASGGSTATIAATSSAAFADLIIGFAGKTNILNNATAHQGTALISSGASSTVAAGISTIILDGATSPYTLTMPAAPLDGTEVLVLGAIAALTVSANSGQSIKGTTASVTVDQGHCWRYRTSNTTWYKKY